MIERVHRILSAEAFFLRVGIPVLPDRRRSLGHRIQPRRECRLQHHLPGILHSALLGQHLVQNTRSKESRSDRMADRSRLSDQMLSYSLSVFCHTIRQCNCIRALRITQRSVRIAGLSGIRKYKCLIPEFLHLRSKRLILMLLLCSSERTGNPAHQIGFFIIKCIP